MTITKAEMRHEMYERGREQLAPTEPLGHFEGGVGIIEHETDLMVVSHSVSEHRSLTGRGPLAEKFRSLLLGADIDSQRVYKMPFYRHNGYAQEKGHQAHAICQELFLDEIDFIQPKVVLLMGVSPITSIFGPVAIGTVAGQTLTTYIGGNYRLFIASHPIGMERRFLESTFAKAGATLNSGGQL